MNFTWKIDFSKPKMVGGKRVTEPNRTEPTDYTGRSLRKFPIAAVPGFTSATEPNQQMRYLLFWEQDNSSTRQLIDTVFGDNSSTQLKTTHRHFLKTIHRHIIILQLYPS